MNSAESQMAGLRMLLRESSGWQAMILINRPGDTPFVTGVSPRLRGYEIVCYSGDYDIWKQHANGKHTMVKSDLSLEEVSEWIRLRSPKEKQFLANGARWMEETLKFYRVPQRKAV